MNKYARFGENRTKLPDSLLPDLLMNSLLAAFCDQTMIRPREWVAVSFQRDRSFREFNVEPQGEHAVTNASDEPTSVPGRGRWFKSSFSDGANCCVEVQVMDSDQILVRDSKYLRDGAKDPLAQPVLAYTPDEWRAFIAGVKAGEFDI